MIDKFEINVHKIREAKTLDELVREAFRPKQSGPNIDFFYKEHAVEKPREPKEAFDLFKK